MRKHSIQHPRARRPLLALVTGLALVLPLTLAATAPAAHHAHKHGHKSGKKHRSGNNHKKGRARKASAPMSGIYDACSYSEPKNTPIPNCDDRLVALRQGGFQVVLNYWSAAMTVDQNLEYADTAQSLGMQVIWNLSNYRSESLDQKLDLVRATAAHPATWGYYVGDEVRPEDRWQVAQLSGEVRSMTRKPLMYVSRPNPSMMRPFRKLADFVGPDSYPYGPFDPPTCQTSRWASKMAPRNAVMVLQAYSWSIDFPDFSPDWPNAGQMREMRNQATRCGRPKLLMWFCFHCITDYNPDPDAYWRQLAWAANGVNLGPNYRLSAASF
jgi:hypothetical protein